MATIRLDRIDAQCAHCGKTFIAIDRPNRRTQRYCCEACQRESREPNDLPNEVEIKRRAGVIKHLREKLGIVKITQDMLDWYEE